MNDEERPYPEVSEDAHPLTAVIVKAVNQHDPEGFVQWYVDEFCVDVSARELWDVVDKAVRAAEEEMAQGIQAALQGQAPGPASPQDAVPAADQPRD